MLIEVEIKGITAMLQHRFTGSAEVAAGKATRQVLVKDEDPREVAERGAYRMPDTRELFFPGAAVGRLLREAGSNHKLKGTRKSLKYIIPAAVVVVDDAITLRDPKTWEPLTDFEVDSRPVVIPATKGRVMRHRAKFNAWGARFTLMVRENLLPVDVIQQLLTEGGQQNGLGDFRPEKGGPFGMFRVTKWAEKDEADEADEAA
jgi:hypothetical protein